MERPLFTRAVSAVLIFTYGIASSTEKKKKLIRAAAVSLTGILFIEFTGICRYTDGYGNFTYLMFPFQYIIPVMFIPPILLIMSFTLRGFVRIKAYTLITVISVFIIMFIIVFLIVGWNIFPDKFYNTGIFRDPDRRMYDSLILPALIAGFAALCAPELTRTDDPPP